jgi:UDP-galactopyranose mutase
VSHLVSSYTHFQEENSPFDLVCLSHLRWDFVYQRPQHLLSRAAKQRRVFFFEEPVFVDGPARLDVSQRDENLYIVAPLLPTNLSLSKCVIERLQPQFVDEECRPEVNRLQRGLLDEMMTTFDITSFALWYYTPMALSFSDHLRPVATIYDCMDELSAFKNAPPALREQEAALLERATLVFTGGQSLYEAKRSLHPHVYAFPSSVDATHFRSARLPQQSPADQESIPHPRLGFYGVIDERFDRTLIAQAADARPDWHFIFLGPIVKIEPSELPQGPNIHYLGSKPYEELPAYLAGWDVALLPFAHNDSTRFISPTKTLEYLAGGIPVVSTSIRDVVSPYGEQGLVRIADTPATFVAAVQEALDEQKEMRLPHIDAFLARTSWDGTWKGMNQLIETAAAAHQTGEREKGSVHV